MTRSIRSKYEESGVAPYYAANGRDYRNPHEEDVAAAIAHAHGRYDINWSNTLDLCCGSGEVSASVLALQPTAKVTGVDPYTGEAYLARIGCKVLPFSFDDVIRGALRGRGGYSLIVCSYALHLVDGGPKLGDLCWQLSQLAPHLLVVSPNSGPEMRGPYRLLEGAHVGRAKMRLYESEYGRFS